MLPTDQPTEGQDTSDAVIQVLLHLPEYKEKAAHLAAFIRSCRQQNVALCEKEYWKIKGKTYRVVKDMFGINFMLLTIGENKKLTRLWLSELLPLSINDVSYISGKK
ncbi:MAG: hypothetical protein CMD31_13190 [Flavobacteriales bacterium]|jgi:hypothetical protein|nr:hypothetical protein [Flavobacteriales bacterium]|tara:strand:- start:218 stop:538 length:321 start_codon:yes stop_codon:yes gene_type:complete